MKVSLSKYSSLLLLTPRVFSSMANPMNGNEVDEAKAAHLTNHERISMTSTWNLNSDVTLKSSSSRPVRYLRESKREVEDSSAESGRKLMSASTMRLMGKTLEDHLNGMVDNGAITVDQKSSILSYVGNIDNSVVYDKRNDVDKTFNKQMLQGYIKGQEQSGRLSNEVAAYLWNLLNLQQEQQSKGSTPAKKVYGGGGTYAGKSQSRSPAKKGYGGGGTYPGGYSENGVVKLLGHIAAPNPEFYDGQFYSGIWGYYDDSTGKEYALQTSPGALHIIDITDPIQPKAIQKIDMKGGDYWRDVATHRNYAYVGAQGSTRDRKSPPYYIVDMSNGIPVDGSNIKEVSGYNNLGHTVNVENGIFCLNFGGSSNGCTCFDVETNPWQPQEIFQWSGQTRDCHDSFIREIDEYTTIFVSAEGYGERFSIVNITDTYNPVLLSQTPIVSNIYAHSSWMTEDNKYLFGFDENNLYDIIIYDVSDLSKPMLLNQLSINDSTLQWSGESSIGNSVVHNGAIRGNYLYVAYFQAGLRVFDISNPKNIIEVGMYETYWNVNTINNWSRYDGAWNVYTGLPSGNILVSDSIYGTFILSIEEDLLQPPVLDSSLTVTRTIDGHQLTWVHSNNATGYNIYRGSTVDSVTTLIAENIVDNSYIDNYLPQCQSDYYYVTAINGAGESNRTNIVTDESYMSPCESDEICIEPSCTSCSNCNTNEKDCIDSGCSYTEPPLPPIGCSIDGTCELCSKTECQSKTGICHWAKNSCSMDPNYTGGFNNNNNDDDGTCSGIPSSISATCIIPSCTTDTDCNICIGETCSTINGSCEVTNDPIQCNFCNGETCNNIDGSCVSSGTLSSPPNCTLYGCDVNTNSCYECLNDSDCDDDGGSNLFCIPNICNNGYCESGSNPCSGDTPICDEDNDQCVAGPSCLDAGAACSNASDCCSSKCRGGTCKKK